MPPAGSGKSAPRRRTALTGCTRRTAHHCRRLRRRATARLGQANHERAPRLLGSRRRPGGWRPSPRQVAGPQSPARSLSPRSAGPFARPGSAPPQNVIGERVANLDVIFAIDDSASVHGPDGTDPRGARNTACLSVVDLMHRHGGGRAGVIHWGDTAPASLALAPVPVHRGQLRRRLELQPVLGGTQPAGSTGQGAQAHPGNRFRPDSRGSPAHRRPGPRHRIGTGTQAVASPAASISSS